MCAFKSSKTLIPALVFMFKIYISKSNETSILDNILKGTYNI